MQRLVWHSMQTERNLTIAHLHQTKEFADVTLSVGDKTILAHSFILMQASEYYEVSKHKMV